MVTCKQLWGFVVATCMTIYGQVCLHAERELESWRKSVDKVYQIGQKV